MMKKESKLFVSLVILSLLLISGVVSAYNEAPMLKELVDKGELPPVDERLPENPVVIEPNDEIGKYGGTLVSNTTHNTEFLLMLNRTTTDTIPNVVESWEFKDEGKELYLYLRKGIKWSDGHPYTADDIMFWYEHELLNEDLTQTVDNFLKVDGEVVEFSKLNNYTIKVSFAKPYYGFLGSLNSSGNRGIIKDFSTPAHFYKKYHIEFNKDADKIAQEKGFENWWQYYTLLDTENGATEMDFEGEKLGKPTLKAWVFEKETPTTIIYKRNPYYFKVDSEGNQLPYIDNYYHTKVKDSEALVMNMLNGDLDFVAWGTGIASYPVLKKNEDKGNYRVWMGQDLWGAAPAFVINQTLVDDPVMADILRNKEFRQALSLAIDRNEINEVIALGQGTVRQATIHPATPGFQEEWAKKYAEYDSGRANQMLDSIGLDKRNEEGWRLRPDGKVLNMIIPTHSEMPLYVPTAELIKDYWERIGVKTTLKIMDSSNLMNFVQSSQHHLFLWVLDRVHGHAFMSAKGSWMNPTFWFGPIGPNYKTWFSTDGENGMEPPVEVKELVDRFEKLQNVSPEEQKEIIKFAGDTYAEQVYMIGAIGMIGKPVLAHQDLGNVREEALADNISIGGTRNQWQEQFYWKTEDKRNN